MKGWLYGWLLRLFPPPILLPHAVPTGSESEPKRFRFIRKEHPVFRFHALTGGAVEASVDFQQGVATECDFACPDEGAELSASGKAEAAQVCMPDHLASCKGMPSVIR